MKFTSILLCAALLLLLFVGCKSTPDAELHFESGVTLLNPLDEQLLTFQSSCLDTPDGFYYPFGYLLYFCPKGGDCFVPLCGKPDCEHNDVNCNASLEASAPDGMGYYDGVIYSLDSIVFQGDFVFTQRNRDGTDHKTTATVNRSQYGFRSESSYGYQLKIYGGKAYIALYSPWGTPGEHLYHMVVVNLTDGSQTEFGAELFRNGGIEHPYFKNGKMYGFAVHNVDLTTGEEDSTLMEVELETGEATEIPLPTEKIWGQILVTDSTVYYLEKENAEEVPSRLRFKEYDRASGAVKDYESPVEITTDNNVLIGEDYIYILPCILHDNAENMYILSRDYKLVDQIELREGLDFFAATKDRIYFKDYNVDPEAKTDVYVYYLEKSQIGSHNLTLEKLPVLVPQEEWDYFPDEEE